MNVKLLTTRKKKKKTEKNGKERRKREWEIFRSNIQQGRGMEGRTGGRKVGRGGKER